MRRVSFLQILTAVLLGLIISLAYGFLSSALLYFLEGLPQAKIFLMAYNTWFKILISFALILGAALVVIQSQYIIPDAIEKAFTADQLAETNYYLYRHRFLSSARSIVFATEFAVVGFVTFSLCQFPLQGLAELLLIIPACAQYALGIYVLRKVFYATMMLNSLRGATVTRKFFKKRKFMKARERADTYLHFTLMLAIVFGYFYFSGYNEGPFLYKSLLGEGARFLLMLPALLAVPVLLILSWYPGRPLRKYYVGQTTVEEGKAQNDEGRTLGEKGLTQSQEVNLGNPTKRFRVAFSFAGEKRKHVAKVAAILATRFGESAILYDKFHEAEFARRDLGFYLPDLYYKESDLVVVVVCPDYEGKDWCGLEWDAIFDLMKRRKNQEIMLCRFGHAMVRGLYSTAGFLELDDLTADQIAARILERLALNEDKPRDYYLSGGK